jgi:hypothetical protein
MIAQACIAHGEHTLYICPMAKCYLMVHLVLGPIFKLFPNWIFYVGTCLPTKKQRRIQPRVKRVGSKLIFVQGEGEAMRGCNTVHKLLAGKGMTPPICHKIQSYVNIQLNLKYGGDTCML